MTLYAGKNRRIARNTAMLYFRMLLTMLVGLYTSRIVLSALGVDDYGIYNIVGGVVALFSFLNAAMSGATQRFLNVELGRGDHKATDRVFNASITIHLFVAVAIFLLAETIGLWVLKTQLNLPEHRMDAAEVVYQCSIATAILGIVTVPFSSSIVTHERMSFYAYLGITEVFAKLAIAFLLQRSHGDRLILYGALLVLLSVGMLVVHIVYCYRRFDYSPYRFRLDKELHGKLLSFSGWSLFGGLAVVGKSQGVNIFLNVFYGVAVNAAMGITNQVSAALNSFVTNFQTAFNPQIVQSHAAGQKDYLEELVRTTSKYSYYLLLLLALPVLLQMDYILSLWLKTVPPYAVSFCRLTLVALLPEALSGPLWMVVQATGRIRRYQLVVGSVLLLCVPVSYLLLYLGFPPYTVVWTNVGAAILTLGIRIWYIHKLAGLSSGLFLRRVLGVVVGVTLLSLTVALPVRFWAGEGLRGLGITTVVTLCWTAGMIYFVGMTVRDKQFIHTIVREVLSKIIRRWPVDPLS